MISKVWERLNDPEYRKAFVSSQINIGIPFQIRALLKERGKTQEWLAEKSGMLQPRISGLMTPGKTRPNIETLRRIAEAFDCGLSVRFLPFSELVQWSEEFDPEGFSVPSFGLDSEPIEMEYRTGCDARANAADPSSPRKFPQIALTASASTLNQNIGARQEPSDPIEAAQGRTESLFLVHPASKGRREQNDLSRSQLTAGASL